MKQTLRKKAVKATVVSTAALVGLAAGTALAAISDHTNIVLKDHLGANIKLNATNVGKAYSVKTTCFTTDCHGDPAATGNAKFTYDEIERHSYHAMNGSNEIKGFNPWNPDATVPEYDKDGVATGRQVPDAFRRSVTPQGKNWVQGPAHIGSW